MSKKILALNVVLAGVAVFLAVWLVRDLAATRPLPPPVARKAAGAAGPENTAPENAAQDRLTAYNVIVAKYLFSPSRTEGAPEVAKPVVPLPPKPILLGVVVDGPSSRAYLEDPSTKRVFGYQVGDSVAGGKLEKITDDRIQISRSDGVMDVLLRDPAKPRPPAPVQAAPRRRARRSRPRRVWTVLPGHRPAYPGAPPFLHGRSAECLWSSRHRISSIGPFRFPQGNRIRSSAADAVALRLLEHQGGEDAAIPGLQGDGEDGGRDSRGADSVTGAEARAGPCARRQDRPAGPCARAGRHSRAVGDAAPATTGARRPRRARRRIARPEPDRSSQPVVRIRQAQTAPAGQPTPQSPGRLVVFNFDNADIEIVLQATSELLVFNYVLAPGARGKKVTVQTTGRIPVDDIFPVLLTILDVNGLAAVKSGNVWRIIPKEGAVQTSTRTIVGAQLDPGVPGDEVITQLIPLQFTSATDVLNLLRPFVPPQGAITATRDTNLLVVTDAAANIRRLLDILKLVDVDVALNELQILPLKNADAQEVAQILTQLFASGRFRPSGAQLPAGIAPPAAPPAAPGAPPAARGQQATSPDQGSADRAPLIVPERRSNSLIVYARKQEMETIARLVEKLDADIYGGQRVFFYFAENTKAKDLAATLDAIFGRGSGSTSSSTSTDDSDDPADDDGLAGLAEPVEHRGITDPARRLDGRRRSGPELPRGRRPGRRDALHPRRGDELDHRHDLPEGLDRGRGHHQEARPDAASGPDRGARRRGHARRQHEARASVGDPAWPLRREPDHPAGSASSQPGRPISSPHSEPSRVHRPDSTSSPSPPASSWPPSMRWPRTTRSTCCRARRS